MTFLSFLDLHGLNVLFIVVVCTGVAWLWAEYS